MMDTSGAYRPVLVCNDAKLQYNLKLIGMWSLIDRLKDQLLFQARRYHRYRYGKAVGFLLMCILFTMTPLILSVLIPALLSFFSQRMTFVILLSATAILTNCLYNVGMYFIYTRKHPFFEQYRVHPEKAWPWEQDLQKFEAQIRTFLMSQLFNIVVMLPMFIYLQASLELVPVIVDVALIPSFEVVSVQFAIMLFLEDFFFFSTHAAFHTKALYKYHKVHHDDKTTTTLTGFRGHAVENMAQVVLPALIYMKVAAYYAPLHVSTIVIWQIFRLSEGNNSHCGYNFSWTLLGVLPFATSEGYHDFHHSHNVGNYASMFRLWDTLFDTNRWFKKYDQAREAKMVSHLQEEEGEKEE